MYVYVKGCTSMWSDVRLCEVNVYEMMYVYVKWRTSMWSDVRLREMMYV